MSLRDNVVIGVMAGVFVGIMFEFLVPGKQPIFPVFYGIVGGGLGIIIGLIRGKNEN